MKTWTKFYLAAVAMFVLSLASVMQAGPVELLKVDFNNVPGGPTQSGFSDMYTEPSTFSTPSGPVTVSFTGIDSFYDRGGASPPNSGAFTYSDLYRDFVYKNAGSFTATLSGLTANTHYELRLYAFDYNNDPGPNTTTFTPASGTVGATGQVTYIPQTTPIFNDQSSVLFDWISNGSGEIAFNVSDSSGNSRINGFVLSIPEPSTVTLLGLAACALMQRRFQRK